MPRSQGKGLGVMLVPGFGFGDRSLALRQHGSPAVLIFHGVAAAAGGMGTAQAACWGCQAA
ncbi:hypothetical protein [Actinocrispum sp. NPDC049592]|uniref:hypothetical protein n=1 Tax=Actinocrispum sp. NPDC049592 TaxID=3154835 RepID=UPI0034280402